MRTSAATLCLSSVVGDAYAVVATQFNQLGNVQGETAKVFIRKH